MTAKRASKREILNEMYRVVNKPSQKSDAELAVAYLNRLIHEGMMGFGDAKGKVLSHFKITDRELMQKYDN